MNLFQKAYIYTILLFSLLVTGCGSIDLSLVNEVKRFEPEWMNLSETVTYIDKNMDVTLRRYDADWAEVEPYMKDPRTISRSNLQGLRSQYMNMKSSRDEILENFQKQKEKFVKEVDGFNSWVNQLMKNKLDQDDAAQQFKTYKKNHEELKTEMISIQEDLIKNIQEHNSILRQITSALRLYTNFDINPK